MSDYSLAQRGVITADETDAAGVSPKTVTLGSTIKPASAFIVSSIRDTRKNVFVQRGIETIDNPDTTPRNVAITAVVLAASKVEVSAHEVQTGTALGVRARLTTTTNLELVFTNPGAGDSIEVAWEVIQYMQPRSATLRILDPDNVRLEWDGTLVAGESIVASFDVWDIENFGDDIKELLFRLQRIAGYLGENCVQDELTYDDAGNLTKFRLRLFDSKVNAEDATADTVGGLETGETARVDISQTIRIDKNDRILLLKVLTDLIVTPGVN